MAKKSISFIILFFLIETFGLAQGIRKPVYAGLFYDGRYEILSHQIDQMLQNAPAQKAYSPSIIGLIAPHAGYVYSGQVAAYAYNQIKGQDYSRVIILGPSHRFGFQGCSIYTKGGYKTPLGVVSVDESFAKLLSKVSGYRYVAQAHTKEHSIEVQIPFIQKTLPQAKIVPIVMGYCTKETINTLSEALIKVVDDKNTLIIASTDLSHYLPKEKAFAVDSETIKLIQNFETNKLIDKLMSRENIACGGGGVAALMQFSQAQGLPKVDVLKHSDSAPFGSSITQVVGYFSATVYLDSLFSENSLTLEDKEEIRHLARKAIQLYIKEKKVLEYETQNATLLTKRGAFVTIKKKGHLRGCIGMIESSMPLYMTVIQAAISAATKDLRFYPLKPEELADIKIEISVLSPLKKIENPNLVKVGTHGLLISRGERRGLLLPQVATEQKWSREEFLCHTCQKAGLPPDAWRKGSDIYIFEAIVF